MTVTDADVALGVIDPDNFLGGRIQIDKAAAEGAIRSQIAEPLNISVVAAAAGIREIVDARMADTLRELTVGRGHDPRDFDLYAYGGAGPCIVPASEPSSVSSRSLCPQPRWLTRPTERSAPIPITEPSVPKRFGALEVAKRLGAQSSHLQGA